MSDNQSILELFDFLPRSNDEFFRQMWHERKLKFDGSGGKTDYIDIYSAQLACAALTQRKSLLTVLPDHAIRRTPLIFITALVMHSLDYISKAHDHRVIYFGTSASIKDYLSQTHIRNQRLSDIFGQTYIGRTGRPQNSLSGDLPKVIFSYTPTNADQIIDTYNPKWVFIDCGEGEKTDWVEALLQKLTKKNIIGIACVNNPLSNVSEIFSKNNWNTFSWALASKQVPRTTGITPRFIRSQIAISQAERFQQANYALSECSRQINGRLQRDAWRAVGRFVNGLENLLIPLKFFEAESRHYWGVYSIQTLQQTAERFVESVETDLIGKKLENILVEVRPIYEQFVNNQPPMWLALEQLCIDPPEPNIPTLLVFQSRAYTQLFSLAMLAENNIAEYELQKLNIWFLSMKQFVQWQLRMEIFVREHIDPEDIPPQLKDQYPRWYPILIGVPRKYNYTKYAHLLNHETVENLLLPHQRGIASWHFNQWINRFDQELQKNLNVMRYLIPETSTRFPDSIETIVSNRIKINAEKEILIDDKSESVRAQLTKLLEISPRAEEFARLMDEFTIQSDDTSVSDANADVTFDSEIASEDAFVEKALVIRFREKYEAVFDLTDKIQVVIETSRGRDLQERSVRSLRVSDVILFINGQQRQSLYDLIVSRVHDHPTFSLHISLIVRWQDELVTCFRKAKIPVSALLSQMQGKGSQIQTEAAIRFWLWRQVMCPSDAKDLQRISEILDMPFVKQYYPQIDKAARRLRGIHISLARKLNTWLEQEVFSRSANSFNDIVDAELGLEFKDFRDSLMILTVKTVTEENGLFLKTDLGLLRSTS